MAEVFPNGTRANILALCDQLSETVTPPAKTAQLGIIIGHNRMSQGAFSPTLDQSEYQFHKGRAHMWVDRADGTPVDVQVFERPANAVDFKSEIRKPYQEADEWGADLVLELHFNAHEDPTATGSETLHFTSTAGTAWAERVQAATVRELGLRDRGTDDRIRGERGWCSVIAGRAAAAVWEPAFGSNPTDAARLSERYALAVDAILREAEAMVRLQVAA